MEEAIRVLETRDDEHSIAILNKAYEAAILGELLPNARLFFMRAVETASKGDEGAALVLELFGSRYSDLAFSLRRGYASHLIARAIDAWRNDHQKWFALRSAILAFDPTCPPTERLARAWRQAGSPVFPEK